MRDRGRFHRIRRRNQYMKRNVSIRASDDGSISSRGGANSRFVVAHDEAPSGMMARGHYEAVSKFVDDDDHTHLKFEWSFDITKDWK